MFAGLDVSIRVDLLKVVDATMQYVDTVDLAAFVSKQDSRTPHRARAAGASTERASSSVTAHRSGDASPERLLQVAAQLVEPGSASLAFITSCARKADDHDGGEFDA